ncbi:M81 family metallopeptidase [Roseibium sp. FZY0029]|uniref:M81 family metallopeptidase n=1 Tax=Roseibium sp. FZY0029 TaxID=3116647 RepID=UPI002E9C50EC|nr:M81 family metallopeptidase [Roseibium sp. FZY0029]
MKIAVGGIHTECSTYSPVLQSMADFKVARGMDLLRQAGVDGEPFADVTFCPLFHARSIPGGPVTADCYSAFKSAFLAELEVSLPLDGLLLIMHGAMHVVGLEDAEGDWISAVRQLVGPRIPIAVSYDLHGNVTQTIVDQIDIFSAYRTAPHIDVPQTHRRAAANLVDQLRGGQRRYVAWAPIPALLPGERTSTEDEPARSLYATLPKYDERHGITDANLMVGYVWADTARATAAAVVTGTDRSAIQKAAIEIATDYWSARQDFVFGVATKPLDRCLEDAKSTTSRPFILADSGDNPTGGGVGDRSDVLAAWLDQGLTGGVFAGIADPASVEKLWELTDGSQAYLKIGGALGSTCPAVTCDVVLLARTGSRSDHTREVLVEVAGNKVILTEHRRPFHYLDDFRRFGIEPSTVRYLIVKSGYLSPELAPIANPARMALTDGAVNQDIERLENRYRQVPCYPFQHSVEWRPLAWLSSRAEPGSDTITNHD